MKPKILFYCLFLFALSSFAQTNPISNPKNINKVDEAAIQKEVTTKVNQITSESQKIIKASELAQKKNNENLNSHNIRDIAIQEKIISTEKNVNSMEKDENILNVLNDKYRDVDLNTINLIASKRNLL